MKVRLNSLTGFHTATDDDDSNSGLKSPRAIRRSLNEQRQIGFSQSIASLEVKNASLTFTRAQVYATTRLNYWINSHTSGASTLK